MSSSEVVQLKLIGGAVSYTFKIFLLTWKMSPHFLGIVFFEQDYRGPTVKYTLTIKQVFQLLCGTGIHLL